MREIAAREYGWHPAIRGESAVTPYESTEEEVSVLRYGVFQALACV